MEKFEDNISQPEVVLELEQAIYKLEQAILDAQKTPFCALYLAARQFNAVRVGTENKYKTAALDQLAKHPDVQSLTHAETLRFEFQQELKELKS